MNIHLRSYSGENVFDYLAWVAGIEPWIWESYFIILPLMKYPPELPQKTEFSWLLKWVIHPQKTGISLLNS